MAADKRFMVKSIQKKEQLFAVYGATTNMPYLICDPDTGNDQVWLFDTEEQLQEFSKSYTEQKIALKGVKLLNKDFLKFFGLLYTIGVNELVFRENEENELIALKDLIQEPDYSSLPKEQQPVLNPQLQLTGLYFMQEVARQVPKEEKTTLSDLEEEFSVNLLKSRFIMPIELPEGPESDAEKIKARKFRLPIMKNNKTGEILQPVFTDTNELSRFGKGKAYRALVINYDGLIKFLANEAKGYVLNPMGYHIMLSKELLQNLKKRYEI